MRDSESIQAFERATAALSRVGQVSAESLRQFAQAIGNAGLTGDEFDRLRGQAYTLQLSEEKSKSEKRIRLTRKKDSEKGTMTELQSTAKNTRIRISKKTTKSYSSKSYEAGFISGLEEGYAKGSKEGVEQYRSSHAEPRDTRERSIPTATRTPIHRNGVEYSTYSYSYSFDIERQQFERTISIISNILRYDPREGTRNYAVSTSITYDMLEQAGRGDRYPMLVEFIARAARAAGWYVDMLSYIDALVHFLRNPESGLHEALPFLLIGLQKTPEGIAADVREHLRMIEPDVDNRGMSPVRRMQPNLGSYE